jgi:hypothetical protein
LLRIVDLITEVRRTTVLYDNVHARWAERDNVRIWQLRTQLQITSNDCKRPSINIRTWGRRFGHLPTRNRRPVSFRWLGYLHYVFDLWAHRWRLTKATGDMIVIRYADDTIVGFQHEHEARAFLGSKDRMRKFELALHPDKSQLIRFGRHAAKQREKLGEGKPETFDFLGSRTSARDHANGARSSSGARRSRNGCEPSYWRLRSSCAG